MAKVVHLDKNSVQKVLRRLDALSNDIDEICVIFTVRTEAGHMDRRILTGGLSDSLEWYGIITGLAHDRFLHGTGIPLDELTDEE